MTLLLCKFSNGGGEISSDGTYANPMIWETSPEGGVLESKYFLRMENPSSEYLTNGRLYAVDSAGPDESDWFSFAADENGGPGEYGDEFLFELPLGSEMPVWIRLAVPDGVEVEPKDDIKVAAQYIEFEI